MRVKLICIVSMFLFNAHSQSSLFTNSKYNVEYYCPPCGCPDDDKTFQSPGVCASCNMAYNTRVKGLENKPTNTSPRRAAAILLFDYADIMDVTGPMSVFEHAGFNVVTVAKDENPKRIGRYTDLTPDYTFLNLPKVDVIVVPGGGPAERNQDMDIVNWLKEKDKSTDTMFSVCSGAFYLALAGILDGNEATTFASLIPALREQFPQIKVLNNVKYSNNGHVITSSGLSSGIDASFEVVAKYYGVGGAQDIANHMEYPWKRRNDYVRTQLADNYIIGINNLIRRFATKYTYSEGDMNEWEYRFILWSEVDKKAFINLVNAEIEKLDGFLKSKKGKTFIKAEINHKDLKNGIIELNILKKENKTEVSLRAKRLRPVSSSKS
ncbi:DJ-1/PfpI family protein [uncultured Winogradskyella sp.]|uniref:DJ-1/PfpI family protein n=1 Tax=uncultured Winogradskyella sp. TaxID=395353 RepID=UPI002621217F|nr:DJ-1/PfpI family protein [uncultured Winogradskyella sp.]